MLESLGFSCDRVNNDAMLVALSNSMIDNCKLRNLHIITNNVSSTEWVAFSTVLLNPNSPLESLCLHTSINDDFLNIFRIPLINNSRLRELTLDGENLSFDHNLRRPTTAEWVTFLNILREPSSVLEKLHLRVNDEVLDAVTVFLSNNNRLRELCLESILQVADATWVAFSTVLGNPNSVLEKLDLQQYFFNDHVMNSFADKLVNNESLRELMFCRNNDSYASFTRILCSNSSILGRYQSNHTLERLCSEDSKSLLPIELTSVLQINSENSKSQIARLKIIKTHFSGSDINTLPFTDMELEFLPSAIAWMGRDCSHNTISDVLFALLRNMPSLCDMKSKNKKRKWVQ